MLWDRPPFLGLRLLSLRGVVAVHRDRATPIIAADSFISLGIGPMSLGGEVIRSITVLIAESTAVFEN